MPLDDLKDALGVFQNGLKEFQLGRSIKNANETVQQIRASDLKEEQKRAQLQQVSNQLVTELASRGTPDTTIESVRNAFGGKLAKNSEELMAEAVQTGNSDLQDMALKLQKHELTAAKMKLDAMGAKRDFSNDLAKQKFKEGQDVATNKEFTQLSKRLDSSAEVRSAFGRGAVGIQQANKLEALVNTWGSTPQELDKAPPQAVFEVASALAQMIKTGVATKEEVERFAPKTATQSAAGLQSWLTSKPSPARVGEFVKLYMKAANRERSELVTQQEDAILKRAQGDFRLYKRDPEQFKATVAGRLGIPAEELVIDEDAKKVTTVDIQKKDEDFQMAKSELQKAYSGIKSQDPAVRKHSQDVFNALHVDPKTPYNSSVVDVQYKIRRGQL